ncbi:MAG: ribosomal RNA small subunit methyltransferase A [Candidatus Lambdaproteobacteria bacterium]|nr:ribosomal RNA small subunit methyltransferase A [Candidatus Lambdaproteobacteria bacterium]
MGKRWGQHFLRDAAVLERLLAAAQVVPGESVLEIGPGEGALTGRLLAAGARVTAVEIDPALAAALRARWGGEEAFRLIAGDILHTALAPQALFGAETRYAIVANLPYYLSTPLLFRLLAARGAFNRLLLMVQWEIARRLVATPAQGKEYGALSIAAGHAFETALLFPVPPGAFRPPPKVESAVVRLVPRAPLLAPAAELAFLEHVKWLFTGRRKLMATALRRRYASCSAHALDAAGALVGMRRAEALTPEEHLHVFRLLTEAPPPGP